MTKILGGLALVMVLAVSCGGDSGDGGGGGAPGTAHGTVEQVHRRLYQTMCERVRACGPAEFAQAYPTGVQGCVDRLIQKDPPGQLSQPDPCNDAEVSACDFDLKNVGCDAIKANAAPPSSCTKC